MQDCRLDIHKHLQFIKRLDARKEKLDYWMLDHLRMNGIYWALTALCLLGHFPNDPAGSFNQYSPLTRQEIVSFVLACQHPNGGFGGNLGHDPHLLFTLGAVQIMSILGELEKINVDLTVSYIQARQLPDGSFNGDEWGELDTRFSYCAVAALSLLGRLESIDCGNAIAYINSCRNPDGGYGVFPGAESHAGQVFCCLSALSILNALDHVDKERLVEWLVWRQLPCGGLNGRPEKLEDVCYSWWVLSSLSLLNPKLNWIDRHKLRSFIFACQDTEEGGFADRPGDLPDLFHTLFAIAGLGLLGLDKDIALVDPRYCLPAAIVEKIIV